MSLEKITCPACGHSWLPRVANPKKCVKCGAAMPIRKNKFLTKKQLFEQWLMFVIAGISTLFVGIALSVVLLNVTGILLGLIGFLFFFVLGNRFYVEWRIYDLLHKPSGE